MINIIVHILQIQVCRDEMGLEIHSFLPISFQYHYPFADNLILKIGRSVVENSYIEINPGFHPLFEGSSDLLGELEPLIRGQLSGQMDGHIDIMKSSRFRKDPKT